MSQRRRTLSTFRLPAGRAGSEFTEGEPEKQRAAAEETEGRAKHSVAESLAQGARRAVYVCRRGPGGAVYVG